jgi:hypothetical protein
MAWFAHTRYIAYCSFANIFVYITFKAKICDKLILKLLQCFIGSLAGSLYDKNQKNDDSLNFIAFNLYHDCGIYIIAVKIKAFAFAKNQIPYYRSTRWCSNKNYTGFETIIVSIIRESQIFLFLLMSIKNFVKN